MLKSVIAGLALLSSGSALAEAVAAADAVFLSGKVLTFDRQDRTAEAVAVRDGRIVYVGTNAAAKAMAGAQTRVIDLKGRVLMPGFVDGHVHPLGGGAQLQLCNLEYLPLTTEQFLARIQACLDREPNAPATEPLSVVGWYRQYMQPAGTDPNRDVLDRLRTSRPVVVTNRDGHSTLVNSRALELAGIDNATPNPPGGSITRDATGRATGILEDAAARLVTAKSGTGGVEAATVADGRAALKALAQAGVTSILDAYMTEPGLKVYQELARRGELTLRVHAAIGASPRKGETAEQVVARVRDLRDRYDTPATGPVPALRVHTAKLVMDGVIQAPAQTAGLIEPYWKNHGDHDHPNWGPGDRYGPIYLEPQQLTDITVGLARVGIEPHVHAIGDRAVKVTLDAFEAVRKVVPDDRIRPAVAHAELVAPADYARFKTLNAVPVMSYQWSIPAPNSVTGAKNYLGPERFERMEPFDKLDAAGARVVYGSDWPVDRMDYWLALKAGVTRAGGRNAVPEFRGRLNAADGLARKTALRSITIDGAWALHAEREVGSIEPGKLADLIVLERDFLTMPEEELAENRVLLTMVGGKIVHQTEGLGQ
ncbi:amidohydrolase [Novosphingobium piscinae]|uniref:Amidohydrolase n=2 Tax=Novosphingobium piscinae TaxID=1507448 RepID=A0A7X1FWT5_9SPHN|nr:amidohydrolase [Novosphingobium piscinae]